MPKPVEKFTEGPISVAIFENEGSNGPFRTATIQLRYRDAKSGEWKTGNSFGSRDLESLEKAAREARERIVAFQNSDPVPEPTTPKPSTRSGNRRMSNQPRPAA